MKNYIEITNELFEKREKYLIAQKNKRAKIIKISSVACSFVAVCLIGVSIRQSDLFKPKDTGSDLPEGFVQVQPNDYTPEQSQPKPDTQISEDTKQPEQNTQTKDPVNKPDTKDPVIAPEAIFPSIKGEKPHNGVYGNLLGYTIDDNFSPNEVVVTLTLEESEKEKVYTAQDFPNADCFYVFEYDYYPEEYHPEYKGRVTLMLMLDKPSKENVLKTIDILEQDSRVYSAEANFITYTYSGNNSCLVKLTQENTTNDFNYDGIISVEQARINDIKDIDDKNELSKWLVITYDKKNNNEIIKSLLNDNRVSQVIPDYLNISVEPNLLFIVLTDQECQKELEYTVSDFPALPIKEVKNYSSLSKIISVNYLHFNLTLFFKNDIV